MITGFGALMEGLSHLRQGANVPALPSKALCQLLHKPIKLRTELNMYVWCWREMAGRARWLVGL